MVAGVPLVTWLMKDVNGRVNGSQFTVSHPRLTFVYVQNLPYFTHSHKKLIPQLHKNSRLSPHLCTDEPSTNFTTNQLQPTPTQQTFKMLPDTMNPEMQYINHLHQVKRDRMYGRLWERKSTPLAPVFPASAPAPPQPPTR